MMYLACNCLEFTLLGGNMLLGYHWISPSIFLPIYIFLIYFIYFWLRWVFVAACALSLVAASRGYPSSQCVGSSLRWLLLLQSTGSGRVGSVAVAHGLSSCGIRVHLLRSIWDLPRPGIKPVSPALAGGFLTTVPPGKSHFAPFFDFSYPCECVVVLICISLITNDVEHCFTDVFS